MAALSLTLMAFEHTGQFIEGLGWSAEVTPEMIDLILAGFGTHVSGFSTEQQTALKVRLSSYLDTIAPGWDAAPEPKLIPMREDVPIPPGEAGNLPRVGEVLEAFKPPGGAAVPEWDEGVGVPGALQTISESARTAKHMAELSVPNTVKGDASDTSSEAYAWQEIGKLLSSMKLTPSESNQLEGDRGDLGKWLINPGKKGITGKLPDILERIQELKDSYGL